jgi:L-lactate dehydrogenase complex protein LldG
VGPGFSPATPDASWLVERFTSELTALAGTVHHASSLHDVARIIVDLAARQPSRRVLSWSDEAIGLPGLAAELSEAGLELVESQLDHHGPARPRQIAELAAASIGISGADAAIARTGSVVVVSGPGRPRLASLLTPVHIAIVQRSTIVESLPHLLAARPDLVTAGSNFVCITGPSRTADIEHTLSRGVHGPGDVHAILI